MLKGRKVLVTGAAGFIGSNLVDKFLAQDNEVICLDNFSTGKRENIQAFLEHPKCTFIEGDIRNIEDCQKAVEGVEIVFHQAALGSVPRSINDPITTNAVNISGFLNMLTASKDANVKRFIYAASSSTYGDHPGLPKEEDKIGKPLSPYAVTKYVNELYADVFHKTYGIDTIGLRYFNVFGRRQDPHGAYAAVIPKFVIAMLNGESPTINGEGDNSRDFTYIENVLHANEQAAITDNENALNEVYNVAFGERTDLKELYYLIQEYLSEFDPKVKEIDPIFGPPRQGDVKHSLASIEKGKTLMGYQPKYNIKEGLKEATIWYYNYLK
ncbi:SDR family NAD(P)-dependent oxidoreductase [Flammeovirga yaeyamensis]|uniref:SDR family NAD(P)-dependent oxidoreductase n=1 Tax=Flammeovirga yaeyamensis TaxID=367791 RepID=A0AAX1N490_9BACT|nr:SDR family oxidoreductase [Flammeovirga yaeyamensis]MBB3699804.1 UDP-N-acetylglucosamine 4-epimerase [Flammeovirga yaeyamensis]NMF36627.1 SDR family oxidoreductase [Flammeovirga yaeyamensis]QWG02326.1 SDR family NAD(P)-dependent oxidoreductase [Flammeovirga yaeyamensis]